MSKKKIDGGSEDVINDSDPRLEILNLMNEHTLRFHGKKFETDQNCVTCRSFRRQLLKGAGK